MVTICRTVLLAEASSPTVDSTSPLKTWSVDEVVKFMEKSELAEHAGMFKEHVSEKKYLILCPFEAIISFFFFSPFRRTNCGFAFHWLQKIFKPITERRYRNRVPTFDTLEKWSINVTISFRCGLSMWVTLEVNKRSRPVDFFLIAGPSFCFFNIAEFPCHSVFKQKCSQ